MALRDLKIILGLDDEASQALESVDSQVDDVKGSLTDTQDSVEDLGDITSGFASDAASDFDIVGSSAQTAGEDIEGIGARTQEVESDTSSAASGMEMSWGMIGGAIAGAGWALENFAQSQLQVQEDISKLAITLDETEDDLYDMYYAMTDVTMSTEDAVRATQRLQQTAGIDTKEQMEELIPVFDKFSDATGVDMVEAIEMAERMTVGLGGDMEDFEDIMDDLTWMQSHTTAGTREMGRVFERSGDDIRELGLSADDVILAMSALSEEGMSGREIQRGFQDALRDSEGSAESFWQELEVTDETLENTRESLSETTGLTKEMEEAHADSYTVMQRMQSVVGELTTRYAPFIDTISMLSPLLMGFGTALGVVAAAKYVGLVPATLAAASAVWTFTVALLANPITWIVAAVIGLVAVIWWMVSNWDEVSAWLLDLWDTIREWAVETWHGVWDTITETVSGIYDTVVEWFSDIVDWLSDLPSKMLDIGADIIGGLIEGMTGMAGDLWDAVTGLGESIGEGITDFFGIRSPSELMAEYGQQLGEGLNVGIEEESKRVHEVWPRYTPERDFGQAEAGTAAGTFSPQIQVTVNAQNGNTRSTAREISAELKRTFRELQDEYFAEQRRRRGG